MARGFGVESVVLAVQSCGVVVVGVDVAEVYGVIDEEGVVLLLVNNRDAMAMMSVSESKR